MNTITLLIVIIGNSAFVVETNSPTECAQLETFAQEQIKALPEKRDFATRCFFKLGGKNKGV